MKRSVAYTGAAAFLLAIAWAQSASTMQNTNNVMGAWELVSHDFNGQPMSANEREIKIISSKHFMFVVYDKGKMKTLGAGTGTWTLNGNSYTEHIDFIDVNGAESLNGTDAKFTVAVNGDMMTQSVL
jgi:hypothetical protein